MKFRSMYVRIARHSMNRPSVDFAGVEALAVDFAESLGGGK